MSVFYGTHDSDTIDVLNPNDYTGWLKDVILNIIAEDAPTAMKKFRTDPSRKSAARIQAVFDKVVSKMIEQSEKYPSQRKADITALVRSTIIWAKTAHEMCEEHTSILSLEHEKTKQDLTIALKMLQRAKGDAEKWNILYRDEKKENLDLQVKIKEAHERVQLHVKSAHRLSLALSASRAELMTLKDSMLPRPRKKKNIPSKSLRDILNPQRKVDDRAFVKDDHEKISARDSESDEAEAASEPDTDEEEMEEPEAVSEPDIDEDVEDNAGASADASAAPPVRTPQTTALPSRPRRIVTSTKVPASMSERVLKDFINDEGEVVTIPINDPLRIEWVPCKIAEKNGDMINIKTLNGDYWICKLNYRQFNDKNIFRPRGISENKTVSLASFMSFASNIQHSHTMMNNVITLLNKKILEAKINGWVPCVVTGFTEGQVGLLEVNEEDTDVHWYSLETLKDPEFFREVRSARSLEGLEMLVNAANLVG
jgi:hypothetical protein